MLEKGNKAAYKGPNKTKDNTNGTISISITQDKTAIVDKEDYNSVKGFRWYAYLHRRTFYPICPVKDSDGKQHKLFMHYLILPKMDGMVRDHVNGNGLDNRKINLRHVTNAQNCINHAIRKDSTTGQTGVVWSKKRNKWHIYIGANKKNITLGFTACFKKAVEIRKEAEKKYHGDYSRK